MLMMCHFSSMWSWWVCLWPNVSVRVVLQACLCSWCLPRQAVTRDEAGSVLKSRMQDQASEQSCNIKAHKQTSTPSTWAGEHVIVFTECVCKSFVRVLKYFFIKYIDVAISAAIRLNTMWNTLWITCSCVFCTAVVSWTSALAWATRSQTVQTICPWGLTHSQPLHQILPSTYPVSCITVLKSLFWARC